MNIFATIESIKEVAVGHKSDLAALGAYRIQ